LTINGFGLIIESYSVERDRMKVETALKVIQKESFFLGLSFMETMEFIAKNPLAQPMKTMEAFRTLSPNSPALKKTVKNLMSGKEIQIDIDTPHCCNPATETYWSM
jgi:hypothetical protein